MLSTLRAPSALAARYASTRQREGRLGLRRGRESEGPILLFVLLIDRNFLLRKKRPRFFSSGSPGPFLLLAAALAPSSRSFRGWGTTPSALDALERNERLALDDAFRKRFFFFLAFRPLQAAGAAQERFELELELQGGSAFKKLPSFLDVKVATYL